MSLSQQLEQQLATLGTGPVAIAVSAGADRLRCEFVSVDSLGVSLQVIELHAAVLAGLDATTLKRVADAVAARVTYLLEAIAPIEIDETAAAIQLRSVPPYRRENLTSYYEVLVTSGCIALHRYRKAPSGARTAEPFHLTREVLYRLVDDFALAATIK